jgi:lipoprotein Spr
MASKGAKYTENSSDLRSLVIEKAESYLGINYRKDGKNPYTGFDCSGFVSYVFNQFGWDLKGGSNDIANIHPKKDVENAEVGDLVFFGEKRRGRVRITHVGIIASKTHDELVMIHSSSTIGISKEDINKSEYWKKRLLFIANLIESNNR